MRLRFQMKTCQCNLGPRHFLNSGSTESVLQKLGSVTTHFTFVIETGWHSQFNVPQEERIKLSLGCETHFVTKCSQSEKLGAKMSQLVENKYVALKTPDD